MSDGAQATGPGGNGGERPEGRDASSDEDDEVRAGREAGSGQGGDEPDDRDLGSSEDDERLTAGGDGGQGGGHGAHAVETPEQLLGAVKAVRRRTRFARHAYWFPLVLFGRLTLASAPFSIQRHPKRSGVFPGVIQHIPTKSGVSPGAEALGVVRRSY